MSKPEILVKAVDIMAQFKREFGRPLEPSIIGELYVAYTLGLSFPVNRNEKGFDLVGDNFTRYQVKTREPTTVNVDLNSFDFDYLILFIMDDLYDPLELWSMPRDTAKEIFVERPKYRKFQATQKAVKARSSSLPIRPWKDLAVPN